MDKRGQRSFKAFLFYETLFSIDYSGIMVSDALCEEIENKDVKNSWKRPNGQEQGHFGDNTIVEG